MTITACGNIIVRQTEIDEQLLECMDAPPVPDAPVTKRQDRIFKNKMTESREDCAAKLAAVKSVVDKMKKARGLNF